MSEGEGMCLCVWMTMSVRVKEKDGWGRVGGNRYYKERQFGCEMTVVIDDEEVLAYSD